MKDIHRVWNHRWLTPKARFSSSRIHGFGLHADKRIHKGEIVRVIGGVIVPLKDMSTYRKKYGHIALQINDDFFISPTSANEIEETGLCNHSCEPNLGFSDSITLIAIRDIKRGEELHYDYAFSESFSENKSGELFKCNCGSKNCRKIVRADDWNRKDLQKRYGRYFSPYLKEKFS